MQLKHAYTKIEELENVASKLNQSYSKDMEIYTEQVEHQQKVINDKDNELQKLRSNMEAQSKQIELLNLQLNEISKTNESKIQTINENHEKELQELHTLLDKVSVEFESLKSSTNNTPKNETKVIENEIVE